MRNRESDLLRPTDALNHNKQINFADDNLMGAILVQKEKTIQILKSAFKCETSEDKAKFREAKFKYRGKIQKDTESKHFFAGD